VHARSSGSVYHNLLDECSFHGEASSSALPWGVQPALEILSSGERRPNSLRPRQVPTNKPANR
jgi:hypothetical protein